MILLAYTNTSVALACLALPWPQGLLFIMLPLKQKDVHLMKQCKQLNI